MPPLILAIYFLSDTFWTISQLSTMVVLDKTQQYYLGIISCLKAECIIIFTEKVQFFKLHILF